MDKEEDNYYEEDLYNNDNRLNYDYSELDLIKAGDVFVDEDGARKLRLYFDKNYNFVSKDEAVHETVIDLEDDDNRTIETDDTAIDSKKKRHELHDYASFTHVNKDNRIISTTGYYTDIPGYEKMKKARLDLKNRLSNKNK